MQNSLTWSVLYPEYTPALFGGRKIPVGYAVEPGNLELQNFLKSWVAVEKSTKSIDRIFNYWFKGENTVSKTPRWSIVRDVLHWIE